MRICVSSIGDDLDSIVDDEFGMCDYFIIVDSDTMDYKAIPNEASRSPHGTGAMAAQSVVGLGVDVVLTGFVGPHAKRILRDAGIEIVEGIEGTVRSAIERYLKKTEERETVRRKTKGH
ncbi:MAG: NifB/NifX family molybdenum-iron cluster-binding protein [Methanomassiliicoccales archaeon]